MLHFLAADETGPNPVVPALGEIIIGLITFGLFLLVMMKYVWPRMEATFQARREAIEGGLERAERAQAEAQRALEQYRAQLADARTEAAQIRDGARAEGQRIIDEMRAEAQAESARVVQRGGEQLAAQRQQVVRELREEIGTMAVGLAERIVGQSLADDVRRERTVDSFLDELDGMAQPAAVGGGAAGSAAGGGPGIPAESTPSGERDSGDGSPGGSSQRGGGRPRRRS